MEMSILIIVKSHIPAALPRQIQDREGVLLNKTLLLQCFWTVRPSGYSVSTDSTILWTLVTSPIGYSASPKVLILLQFHKFC